MKVALLCGIFPNENLKEILTNSKGIIQYAADALQKSFIEGLGAFELDIEIINLPFLGSFPKRYSKLFTPSNSFELRSRYNPTNSIKGRNIRYCNLSLIKYLFIKNAACKALTQWAKNNGDDQKIIVIYSLQSSFLEAAISVKYKFPNIKLICIVPDLPQYMSAGGTSYLRKLYKEYNVRKLQRMYSDIDGFVVLSKYMIPVLRAENKPHTVIEGIYNCHDEVLNKIETMSNVKTVFYAGTLAKRYGILRLVSAFEKLKYNDIQLVICGEGDAKSEIEKIAQEDHRIKLTGNIPRSEVLTLIQSSTVLVNPRTAEGEFTKYSFPSKTMEYLASGVPTILYKLPGIDNEYYDYCFALDDISIDILSNTIDYVLGMDENERRSLGSKARDFILHSKNPKAQVIKLIDLIRILTNNK